MKTGSFLKYGKRYAPVLILSTFIALALSAYTSVSKMVIITAPQTLGVGVCSGPVTVQAQNAYSVPNKVPSNTRIFFTGSSSKLQFFNNSTCTTSVSSVVMTGGTNSKSFYFKATGAGQLPLIVATYNYSDDQQIETITSLTATPTLTPSPSQTSTASPTPSTTPPPGVRNIPTPIYGVTFDDVSNTVRPTEIATLKKFSRFMTSRIVFDPGVSASYYSQPLQELRPYTYTMGLIADSTAMSNYTVSSITTRAQQYVQALSNYVDVWEIGNEVNGGWLGSNTLQKIEAMYDVVSAAHGITALTFFYEGEPNDPYNCLDSPSNDMFTWISNAFQLGLPVSQRSAETEKIRLNLNYALISWYPLGCPKATTDWSTIFAKIAAIFPNSRIGFGEIGTASPQYGSTAEINLINQYYPLAKTLTLPSSYVGGYFWWNFRQEMSTSIFDAINTAIQIK